jgi:predicted Fe-Mo cluster-binding NifX family protein
MKVAIAVDGDQVSPHFGRCELYQVATIADGRVQEQYEVHSPRHEPGRLPRLLHQHGVECVVAGGMGPRAQAMFADFGIRVVAGVGGPVQEALARVADGTLAPGDSSCDHGTPNHQGCKDSLG